MLKLFICFDLRSALLKKQNGYEFEQKLAVARVTFLFSLPNNVLRR
jgi:hypothetical protein